jgi:8-oxo-dGTP pyrophosphatase MutT (NUDIX family)
VLRLREISERIGRASQAFGPPPASAKGAVGVELYGSRGPPRVLVIERAEREGDPWSGQLAFPGGRRQRGDRTPLDTARRETKEEVGLSLNRNARLLGWLPARAPANSVEWIVVPYVFALSRVPRLTLGEEAARAFWADLDGLPETLHKAVIPLPMGEIEAPAFEVEGKPLWGFSFRVLCDLFDIVGWPATQPAGRP